MKNKAHTSYPENSHHSPLLPENIIIYGPPASGKSTLGRLLAEKLDWQFVDTDQEIEQTAGKSIARIFADEGEAAFRTLETGLCRRLAGSGQTVIALGGGTLLDPDTRHLLESCARIFVLHCRPDLLRQRALDPARPLSGDAASLEELLAQRKTHYSSFANQLDISGLSSDKVMLKLLQACTAAHTNPYTLDPTPGHAVIAGAGLSDRLPEICAGFKLTAPFVVISDSNVAPLYAGPICSILKAELISFPAGEQQKTLQTVQDVYKQLHALGMERGGTIIALGGGVVGDLAGFVAQTYLRGIRWVNLPTSLLAMIDAGLGGKVGVDMPFGKNMVGGFNPPQIMLADPNFLATLPEREFNAGMAEIIKSALIADADLFAWLGRESAPTLRWLQRSMQIKADCVAQDPYDHGIRASLNLGHTAGHALEIAGRFSLNHGEAVGIGLIAAARIAVDLELAAPDLPARIEVMLKKWGLPVRAPGYNIDELLRIMRSDKKVRAGVPEFILPIQPGEVRIGCRVEEDIIRRNLEPLLE